MITFFTTTKNFEGKNLINQVNALNSWTIGNQYNCEVIILQKSQGSDVIGNLPGVKFIEDIRSSETGVPFINEMFHIASKFANNDILCFLNADIIIDNSFIEKLINIHRKIKKDYLIVGQRIDTAFDYLIDYYHNDWFLNLKESVKPTSSIHKPYGSDFFSFPRGQYNNSSLPDLLVGRPGWDLYMIYNARKRKFKLIDISPSYMVIHQSHDYSHKTDNEIVKKKEDMHNYSFLPTNEEHKYVLKYCNYLFKSNKVIKSYHKFNFRKYYEQEIELYQPSLIRRILLKADIFFSYFFYKINP